MESIMSSKEARLQLEQDYVDLSVQERESQRFSQQNLSADIAQSLARPVKTWTGEVSPKLRYLGEPSDEICFGFVLDSVLGKRYIGKYLVTGPGQDGILVSSWKSPIGAKYYKANIGNRFGLTGKCLLVHSIPNVLANFEETIFEDLASNVMNLTREPETEVSDSVLFELEKSSTGSLKEIIKTIHASQFEIISCKREGLHIVQGAPGTGKTVVGVHRASWLLHPGNDVDLQAEKVLIIGPNISFIRYIEKVLPGLGDDQVAHRDITSIGADVRPTRIENIELSRVKSDLRMSQLLTQGLRDRLRLPEQNFVINIQAISKTVEINIEDLRLKLDEFRQNQLSYANARSSLRMWLANTSNDLLRNQFISANPGVTRGFPFARETDLESATEKIWPSTSPAAFLREFFSSQNRIVAAGVNLDFSVRELLMLVREPSDQIGNEQWSLSDMALLDYLEGQISGGSGKYDYIIVDEVQDLTPMQLLSVKRKSATGDILLLGDLAQSTGQHLYGGWNSIAEILGTPIARLDELKFGYRVPKQIFDYAARVLTYIDSTLKSPTLVRKSAESPRLLSYPIFHDMAVSLCQELLTRAPRQDLVGIIIADDQVVALANIFTKEGIAFNLLPDAGLGIGINLVPVSKQKGLEFDEVYVLDPANILNLESVGLRHLYVALSRALRSMTIMCIGEPPFQIVEERKSETLGLDSVGIQLGSEIHDGTSDSDGSLMRDILGYLSIKGISLGDLLREISRYLKEQTK